MAQADDKATGIGDMLQAVVAWPIRVLFKLIDYPVTAMQNVIGIRRMPWLFLLPNLILFGLFAFLAIFISSLGLFGLVTLMAMKRTREIGIRKILGAEIKEIIFLLSKQYFWLIILANLLAVPISFYWLNEWLQNFAFQSSLTFYLLPC